jgi:flagellar motor switch protein FliM
MPEPPPPRAAAIHRVLQFDERRPTRTWMPTLGSINERFAEFCRTALLRDLQAPVEVTAQSSVEVIRHSELIGSLANPSHLTLARLKPLFGSLLIAAEAELAAIIVETRYGGSGRLPAITLPAREFAPIERQTMCRVIERLLGQWALAWQPVASLTPEIERHETNPAFAAIAASSELLVISVFGVSLAGRGGRLTIAAPCSMLEPLHERLVTNSINRSSRDPSWGRQLAAGVGKATTEIGVELATIEMTVRDFLNLRPGSVFEIARPERVTVQSQGQPLFRGSWGRHGRKIAVRVEEILPAATGSMVSAEADRKGDFVA